MTVLYGLLFLNKSPRSFGELVILIIIMAYFGLIGVVFGGVLGGIVGLIGKLFKKNILVLSLKYGSVFGFIGIQIIWFLGCWIMAEGDICLPQ